MMVDAGIRALLTLLFLFLTGGGPASAVAAGPVADARAGNAAGAVGRAAADTSRQAVDYLWVVRTALVPPSSIDSIVTRARAMGVRGLLVQVVGRGDAYYRSAILPRAEALSNADPGYDPLGQIVFRAHRAGLEVHAWVNCLLVWSAPHRPKSPRHVVNVHPEWVARLRDGRSMMRLKARERRRLRVEGAFLSPARPEVRSWIASIVREIAGRYPIDGIHLDYIRDPDAPVGYDQTTRARFALESSVDPLRIARLPKARRAAADSAWGAFRRAQVTAVVREARDSLWAARPGAQLSAAVIADTLKADRLNAQPWREWIRRGLLDRAYPMCYAASVQVVMDQLVALEKEFGPTDRLVPGIAVFNTTLSTAAVKLKGARALGFPLLALYSYDSLYEKQHGWSTLRDRLDSGGDRR